MDDTASQPLLNNGGGNQDTGPSDRLAWQDIFEYATIPAVRKQWRKETVWAYWHDNAGRMNEISEESFASGLEERQLSVCSDQATIISEIVNIGPAVAATRGTKVQPAKDDRFAGMMVVEALNAIKADGGFIYCQTGPDHHWVMEVYNGRVYMYQSWVGRMTVEMWLTGQREELAKSNLVPADVFKASRIWWGYPDTDERTTDPPAGKPVQDVIDFFTEWSAFAKPKKTGDTNDERADPTDQAAGWRMPERFFGTNYYVGKKFQIPTFVNVAYFPHTGWNAEDLLWTTFRHNYENIEAYDAAWRWDSDIMKDPKYADALTPTRLQDNIKLSVKILAKFKQLWEAFIAGCAACAGKIKGKKLETEVKMSKPAEVSSPGTIKISIFAIVIMLLLGGCYFFATAPKHTDYSLLMEEV